VRARLAIAGIAVLALAVLPFALSDVRIGQLATAGSYFVAILGLNVLARSGGQISLCHGAFMAIGAYTTAILLGNHGWLDLATIPVAAAVAGVIGLIVAAPALRPAGLYVGVVTFGLAVAFATIPRKFDSFLGGSGGISFVNSPHLSVHDAREAYTLTWAVGGALFLLAWFLLSSRFGRAAHPIAAVGISAAFAGTAGALYAIHLGYVRPDSLPVQLSLYLLVGAAVGGYGSIWGALPGALVVEFLHDLVGLLPHAGAGQAGPATFVFGVILIAVILFGPLVPRGGPAVGRRGYSRPR
jgi:branched-chain amino acid transport system permease protein